MHTAQSVPPITIKSAWGAIINPKDFVFKTVGAKRATIPAKSIKIISNPALEALIVVAPF